MVGDCEAGVTNHVSPGGGGAGWRTGLYRRGRRSLVFVCSCGQGWSRRRGAHRQRRQEYEMNGVPGQAAFYAHKAHVWKSTSFASSYYNHPAGDLEGVFLFCFFKLVWLCVGFFSHKLPVSRLRKLLQTHKTACSYISASFVPLCVCDYSVEGWSRDTAFLWAWSFTACHKHCRRKNGLGKWGDPFEHSLLINWSDPHQNKGLCLLLFEVVTRCRVVKDKSRSSCWELLLLMCLALSWNKPNRMKEWMNELSVY